jgi:hypothetical protein
MSLAFTSWSFDSASYVSGQTVTLTVLYTSTDVVPDATLANAVTVALSDASGSLSQSSDTSGNFPSFETEAVSNTPQPTTVSATDSRSPSGTWTVVSNTIDPTQTPFAGTAVLTSVA